MQILRAADRAASPWKNGGGVTCEIAASPPGSSLADFDWRVSTAVVAADGAFSHFPDVERTLLLIAGGGMALQVGQTTSIVTTVSEPLQFAGDAPTTARLLDGPVSDLNVMVRRGRWRSVVRRRRIPPAGLAIGPEARLLVTLHRAILSGGGEVQLEPLDAVLARDEALSLHPCDGEATVVTIELEPVWGRAEG